MSGTRTVLIVFLLSLSAPVSLISGQDGRPLKVSIVELIANPEKFDGRPISVTGFLCLDPPDGDTLYLHQEDCDHGILSNGVRVIPTKQIIDNNEDLDLNYVVIVGVFRRGDKRELTRGDLMKITICTRWSPSGLRLRRRLSK